MAALSHSDSESEDHNQDPLDDDRDVLREEEEREKLLTTSKSFKDASHEERYGDRKERRRLRRREQKKRRKPGSDREGTALYKMEEGGKDGSSQLSSRSSMESLSGNETASSRTRRLRLKVLHVTIISVTIAMAFSLLILGAFKMSEDSWRQRKGKAATISNGTSKFAPTTILVSLDGFRADFLDRGLTPVLNAFVAEGVSPRYMLPSFPSVTFPNHYTIITGLYPETHGIVSNSFWDPDLREEFFYTDPARSMQPKWWAEGEPLWVTAAKQNVKSAIHMWPGSEAHIQMEPAFLDKFNGTEALSRKVDRVLELVDLPGEYDPAVDSLTKARPQFIAFYVPNVDADGHLHGPNSTEIRTTISDVDAMLGNLFAGLQKRNLTDIVNIVVVSDHGMATTSIDRLIQLDDLVDLSLIEHIDGWPLHGLRPKDSKDLRGLYEEIVAKSAKNSHFDVYLRDENMPERYHFTNNKRIAPLWIVPKTGWAIVEKRKFDIQEAKKTGRVYRPRGLHGYDHEHPLMRAIFIARGPAFPHQPNSRLDVFQNIEVYNIVCDSLGIKPESNNGTLRLPLKPVGLHSDDPASHIEVPADPPLPSSTSTSVHKSPTATPISHSVGVDAPEVVPTRPVIEGGGKPTPTDTEDKDDEEDEKDEPDDQDDEHDEEDKEDEEEETSGWWQAFINKVNQVKDWAAGLFEGKKEEGGANTEDRYVD